MFSTLPFFLSRPGFDINSCDLMKTLALSFCGETDQNKTYSDFRTVVGFP